MEQPYAVKLAQTAQRIYKKLDAPVQKRVVEEFNKIAETPYAAAMLAGTPWPIRSHHFSHKGTQWRIAYTCDDKQLEVTVVFLGVRENFVTIQPPPNLG